MNVLVIDDNEINPEIASYNDNVKLALPKANIFEFLDPLKAKYEIDKTNFDLAFMDIE